MHVKTAIAAMTALALLAGCNRGAANNSASANASANAAANAASPAAPAAPVTPAAPPTASGGPVDQAFLVGHWGAAGNCAETITFNADGTATAAGDQDPVRWTLNGATLTIAENNEPRQDAAVSRNGDLLVIDPVRGDTLTLTRCPAAGTGRAGNAPPPSN